MQVATNKNWLWVMILFFVFFFARPCFAARTWENEDTGYEVYINDGADLLSDSEERDLLEDMQAVTQYGHAMFVTTPTTSPFSSDASVENYCQKAFIERHNYDLGVLAIIDMRTRYIYIYANEDTYKTITKSVAETITDNVYQYAKGGDYYRTASQLFKQVAIKLAGGKIAQPMKYVNNALLAVILSVMFVYLIARTVSRSRAPSYSMMLGAMIKKCNVTDAQAKFVRETRVYDPPSSSSGGGGHGGGGGGGHSGGGGGHHF